MKRSLLWLTLVVSTGLTAQTQTSPPGDPVAEARIVAQALGADLKSVLLAAMQAGGPVAAIQVCQSQAAPLGEERSRLSGLHISRTALRVRNPENAPDDWEREQLLGFEHRRANGESTSALFAHHQQAVENGTRHRVLLPILTQPACLACHGSSLSQPVQAVLAERYPQDQATGFEDGDLRGAFSVRWTEPNSP